MYIRATDSAQIRLDLQYLSKIRLVDMDFAGKATQIKRNTITYLSTLQALEREKAKLHESRLSTLSKDLSFAYDALTN